jgi:hypothetical protein
MAQVDGDSAAIQLLLKEKVSIGLVCFGRKPAIAQNLQLAAIRIRAAIDQAESGIAGRVVPRGRGNAFVFERSRVAALDHDRYFRPGCRPCEQQQGRRDDQRAATRHANLRKNCGLNQAGSFCS